MTLFLFAKFLKAYLLNQMRVLALALLNPNKSTDQSPVFLASATDVSSYGFFQRGAAREFLTFSCRQIAGTLQSNLRCTCADKGHHIHAFLTNTGIAAVMICTEDYPQRVAFAIIVQMALDYVKVNLSTGNANVLVLLFLDHGNLILNMNG